MDNNHYLASIGGQVSHLRYLFGYTQQDLAAAIGTSRQAIINIEANGSSLNKQTALALYTVARGEFESMRSSLQAFDCRTWADPAARGLALEQLRSVRLGNRPLAVLLAGYPSVRDYKAVAMELSSLLGDHRRKAGDSSLCARDMQHAFLELIRKTEEEIQECFALESMDDASFLEKSGGIASPSLRRRKRIVAPLPKT